MSVYSTRLKSIFIGLTLTSTGSFALAGNPAMPAYTPDLLPPNPQTGECYARIEIPAQYKTESETVMIQEAYTAVDVSQPQITTYQQDVLVKEASVHYEVRQPTYKTVHEKIMTRPAYERLSVSRPQFTTKRETVQLSNARLVWKKGNPAKLAAQGFKVHSTMDAGPSGKGYRNTVDYGFAPQGATRCGPTCEIWCLVEEPAKHVTYDRKVLSDASRVNRVQVPAKYTTVSKQVVADPGGVREIPIPAKYRKITMEQVNSAVSARDIEVPAQYGSIGKRVMVSPSRYEWRRVVCALGTLSSSRTNVATRPQATVTRTHQTGGQNLAIHNSLANYSRTRQSRTYEERGGSSSRHHFTIPAQGHRTVLPTPVKADVGTGSNVQVRGTSKTRQGKRSKHRYRNR